MPPTKKPQKPTQPPLTVTIRQVEAKGPCSSTLYFDCLDLIKSSPVPDGPYDYSGSSRSFPKKPRYGPDTPIPLIELAKILPRGGIAFLVDRFLPKELHAAINTRAGHLLEKYYSIAVVHALSAQTPPTKKAKSNVKPKSTTR